MGIIWTILELWCQIIFKASTYFWARSFSIFPSFCNCSQSSTWNSILERGPPKEHPVKLVHGLMRRSCFQENKNRQTEKQSYHKSSPCTLCQDELKSVCLLHRTIIGTLWSLRKGSWDIQQKPICSSTANETRRHLLAEFNHLVKTGVQSFHEVWGLLSKGFWAETYLTFTSPCDLDPINPNKQ